MIKVLPPRGRRCARGFTLVEVLTVVAIIGILASLAIPSYQRYLYRAEASELVLKMDRLRGALAELEATTGKRIGSELYVWTRSGVATPAVSGSSNPTQVHREMLWCPISAQVGAGCGQPLIGFNAADLGVARLGIALVPSSGRARAVGIPGTFSVAVTFAADNAHGRQVGLAFVDLMRPYASRVQLGGRAALLDFQLSGPATP